jgi:hypothetical protein
MARAAGKFAMTSNLVKFLFNVHPWRAVQASAASCPSIGVDAYPPVTVGPMIAAMPSSTMASLVVIGEKGAQRDDVVIPSVLTVALLNQDERTSA